MKKYTKNHEWIDEKNRVGISEHAIKELGEMVYVQLPKVGQTIKAQDPVCVIESTKAASDIYTPVSGTITEINEKFLADPTWLFKLKPSNLKEIDALLSESEYQKLIK